MMSSSTILVINDRESHHTVRLPIERDYDTGGTVDQRRKEHRRRIGTEARLSSDSNCAAKIVDAAGRLGPTSTRRTTSGWSRATSASKSPLRAAKKKASTTVR